MKKLLAGVAFLGLFSLATAQTISFDKVIIDYGTMQKGANGDRVFTIKNTGDKPLIITKVQPSCGCTTPKWTTDPIAPGKTGTIGVNYDTNRPGEFMKTIQVSSNDPVNGNTTLHIKGNVLVASTTTTTTTTTSVETAKRVDAKSRPAVDAAKVARKKVN